MMKSNKPGKSFQYPKEEGNSSRFTTPSSNRLQKLVLIICSPVEREKVFYLERKTSTGIF